MVGHYQHKERPYNTETLKIALREIRDGASIRSVAAKYHIGYGKLQKEHMLVKECGEGIEPQTSRGKKGRKTALEAKLERQLANCVQVLEKMGMPPPISEFPSQKNHFSLPFRNRLD